MPDHALMHPLADAFFLEGGPHAVLLIHGFTGSPAHMRPLGEALHEAGLTVYGIRLRGHGTDIHDMMARGADDWRDDARTGLRFLAGRYPKVSVCGLSMGGVLSLLLAAEDERVNACVTLSAPMGTANPLSAYGHWLSPLLPLLRKKDAQERALLDPKYDIGYEEIPTRQCHDLVVLIREARKRLGRVPCPLLCAQSRQDRAIIPKSADIILSGVSSAERERLTLDTSPHVITIGPERGTLNAAVTRFLLNHST